MFVYNLEQGGNLKVVTGNNEAVSHLIYAGSDIMLCLNFLQDQLLQVPVGFQNSIIALSDGNLIKSILSYISILSSHGAAQGFEVRNSSNRTKPPNRVRTCLSMSFAKTVRKQEYNDQVIVSGMLEHMNKRPSLLTLSILYSETYP